MYCDGVAFYFVVGQIKLYNLTCIYHVDPQHYKMACHGMPSCNVADQIYYACMLYYIVS